MVINPSLDTFTMGEFTISCNRELRRFTCMIVDSDKMDQIIQCYVITQMFVNTLVIIWPGVMH